MKKQELLEDSNYDPNKLLDRLIEVLNLKNDAALSRLLEVAPPIISKVRHRVLPVGPALLIRMHEVSDLNIRDLKDLMGDRRQKQRISSKSFLSDGSTAELVDGSTSE
ncbi:hypothetical protein ACFQUU_25125 [Herbaspirillum sp. GCM10030257]|uniref:hypothetical protein n=1 Tax=Herbaspirillum sp. GCM10030257 TaxID=3273393 RepID=UPI00360927E6